MDKKIHFFFKDPTTFHSPEPNASAPRLSIRNFEIQSSYIRLGPSSVLFPLAFRSTTRYAIKFSPQHNIHFRLSLLRNRHSPLFMSSQKRRLFTFAFMMVNCWPFFQLRNCKTVST